MMRDTWDTFCGFYKGKKVLVTGHTGFKGSWLCRILTNMGAEVMGYAKEPPTNPSLFYWGRLWTALLAISGIWSI